MAMPPGPRRYYPSRFKMFVYRTKRGVHVATISGDPPWRVNSINEGRGGESSLEPADLPVSLAAVGDSIVDVKTARAQVKLFEEMSRAEQEKWLKKHVYKPREGLKKKVLDT